MKFKFSIKGLVTGILLGSIAPALAATVTTLYLNGGTAGTSGHVPIFTSDGLGLQDGGTTANKLLSVSWGPGQNLSTAAIPINQIGVTGTVTAIHCRPEVVVGGTATIKVYRAASGTALASGTLLNTTDCNANTGATTVQDMGVASSSITAGDYIGIVSTGAGWSSSAGSGNVQLSITF